MLEWMASVMIAIEPVIAPATSLRTISTELETIETRRRALLARQLGGRADRPRRRLGGGQRPAPALHGAVLPGAPEPLHQRAHGAAAVADRVLLLGRQLGHRAPVVVVVGDDGRVVAEAALAPRLVDERPRAASLGHQLVAARDRRTRARTRTRRGCRRPAAPRAAAWPGSPRRSRPRRRSARSARRARRQRRRLDAGVVGQRGAARGRGRGARLQERVVGERLARLGRQLDAVRQRLELERREQALELAQLVRVAGGEDELHVRRLPRRPPPAGRRAAARCRPRPAPAARRATHARAACARRSPAPPPGRRRRS